MNTEVVFENWEMFANGVWVTLVLTFLSLVIGFIIAVPAAVAMNKGGPVGWFARAYVYVFRGTPLLIQTYLIYYGLSQFEVIRDGFLWPILREAWWCALIAFSLNSGAYVAEILRGALRNTPKGELEAATALGLTKAKVMRLIHLPSAMRRALPQYGNEVIFMLHASAVASVITIQDILGAGRTLNARYYLAYEGLLTAAALYLIITYLLVFIFGRIEKHYLRHLNRDEPKPGLFSRIIERQRPA